MIIVDERKSEFTVKMGKRIEFRRKQLGMNQTELAHMLGYKHKTSISKIEKGINEVSQSMIPEIAKALDTTIGYVMGWESQDASSYRLSAEEREIVNLFRKMNADGKSKVLEYIHDIAENSRYREDTALSAG